MSSLSSEFLEGVEDLGVSLDDFQKASFIQYRDAILKWNENINLTGLKTPIDIEKTLFLDSLSIVNTVDIQIETKILDLGSGAGIPGIPVQLLNPKTKITLVESQSKKTKFLTHILDMLGISSSTSVENERAEILSHREEHREKYDYVLCRGVSSMSVLNELSLPFLKIGGHMVAYKQGDIKTELEDSLTSLDLLGGELDRIDELNLPKIKAGRKIVLIKKVNTTSPKFSRKPGIPQKHPL
ncbi:MAG: 16S rRNA (guanine(527)-N(7))-methyltransferase RsmG [Dehalococcoidia bacterium]